MPPDGALVESVTAGSSQCLKGAGQIRLTHDKPDCRHLSAIEKDVRRPRRSGKRLESELRHAPIMLVDRETLGRNLNRAGQAGGQGKSAVFFPQVGHRRRLPWNAGISVDLNYAAASETLFDHLGRGILNIL